MVCNLKIGQLISFKAFKNTKTEIRGSISFCFLSQTQRLKSFRPMTTFKMMKEDKVFEL